MTVGHESGFASLKSQPEFFPVSNFGIGELRLGRQVARLIALAGARPIVEILVELGCERMLGQVIENKVTAYVERLEALGRETLAALGADRLPNPPIHEIKASGGKSDG